MNNAIYQDFQKHLRQQEDQEAKFLTTPWRDWEGNDWVGLFRTLDEAGILKEWSYVPNQSGGFINAVVNGVDYGPYPLYFQIEQGDLCYKIGEVYEDRAAIRNKVHQMFMAAATVELSLQRPQRFGSGTYMTVAVVSQESWIASTDGIIDMEATIENLRYCGQWLRETIEKNPPETEAPAVVPTE